MNSLRAELAQRIAPVVLANITTPYPYHDTHVFREGDGPHNPASAHPAFSNSYDWHSSVHSHWTALQLLAYLDALAGARSIANQLREAVLQNLSAHNLDAERAYLGARPAYERPYGWAWALKLASAADASPAQELRAIREPLRQLAELIATNSVRWLDMMPAPVRCGVHANTAFALGLMLDASRTLGFSDLERATHAQSRAWFAEDRWYPQEWERSTHDFLSPGLAEADLMRRLLPQQTFHAWWRALLPEVAQDMPIFAVAKVPKAGDGQIVHLHGLNLSRAGVLARIAASLPEHGSGRRANGIAAGDLLELAHRLYRAGVAEAFGDDYLSTHWLATFAWDAASSIDGASADLP